MSIGTIEFKYKVHYTNPNGGGTDWMILSTTVNLNSRSLQTARNRIIKLFRKESGLAETWIFDMELVI